MFSAITAKIAAFEAAAKSDAQAVAAEALSLYQEIESIFSLQHARDLFARVKAAAVVEAKEEIAEVTAPDQAEATE